MRTSIFLCALVATILTATAAIAAPPSQGADGEEYIVQADDWLSKIAAKYLGDMFAYPVIVEATNTKAAEDDSFTVIDNPDLIEVGQKLWIPALAQAAQRNLTLETLKNAAYLGIYNEAVQLAEGKYEGEPFVEGGASRPTVYLIDRFNAFGDLNGDGVEDAAVVLAENSGGSGTFVYLAAVIDQNGVPVNVATQLLGDRVQINSLSIRDGEIALDVTTQSPNDPFCCPSLAATLNYRLQGDQLLEQTDFVGTYTATLPAASSPGRDITLNLDADNTAAMSADYLNGQPPIVETGVWQKNNDGTVSVTFTAQDGQTINNFIIFRLTRGALLAVVYDQKLYGSEGLQLAKQ